MDFLSQALDESTKNSSSNDGKQAHEIQAQMDRWIKNITPSILQVQKRMECVPDNVDIQKFLSEQLGLELGGEIVFPLKNGENVTFDIVKINGKENIESRTYVPELNGRDQNDLTKESMNDIYPLIEKNGQAFPAIGWIPDSESGVIHVLDGSRRRMCCLLSDQTFTVYVAKGNLTKYTAKYIADIARLTKSLSYYEEGLTLLNIMKENSFNNVKELAQYLSEPETTVQYKVNSGRLPETLLKCIPSYNNMKSGQYKKLHRLKLKIDRSDVPYRKVVSNAKNYLFQIENSTSMSGSEKYRAYVQSLENSFNELNESPKSKQKPKPIHLVEFEEKNKSVTVLETRDKAEFILRSMPKEKIKVIQEFIVKTLSN